MTYDEALKAAAVVFVWATVFGVERFVLTTKTELEGMKPKQASAKAVSEHYFKASHDGAVEWVFQPFGSSRGACLHIY